MALVAFGDRTSIAAWVGSPRMTLAPMSGRPSTCRRQGSLIPAMIHRSKPSAPMARGRKLILQENPPRVELLDWGGRTVATRIVLEIPDGHPLHDSWVDAEGCSARAPRSCSNGHLLIAKEKDSAAFVEFGPEGDEPSGFGPDPRSRREPAGRPGTAIKLRPTRGLESVGQAGGRLRDFSDLEVGPDRRLYLHRYSITSSARASSVGGTSRPSVRAVSALITSSNLLDCTTGRSAAFAPLRIRPV